MDLLDSLCYRCFNCWGSTKDHKARCYGYPTRYDDDGLPVYGETLVDYRDECELFEEKDDLIEADREWCMDRIKAKLKPWTSQYGEIRYYLDDWYDLVSDVVEKYAEQEWTSPDIDRIKRCKVWFDQQANIHVDGMKDEVVRELIESNVDRRFYEPPLNGDGERSPLQARLQGLGPTPHSPPPNIQYTPDAIPLR